MRKLFVFTALSVLSLTSCIDKTLSQGPVKDAARVQEMKVSPDFDWETTQTVSCVVESAHVTRVSVSETASGEAFATFLAGGKLAANPMTLNVPAEVQTLYLSYENTAGKSVTRSSGITGRSVTFGATNGRPIDDLDSEEYQGVIYIPALTTGWATIMFEDQWPGYGDYDFNDAVYNYKVQLYLDDQNMVESMLIGLRVKALSGSFPYQFYLNFPGLHAADIGEIERLAFSNTVTGVTPGMVLIDPIDPNKDRPVFRFDGIGIQDNKNQIKGATWLNTEPGRELSDNDFVTVSYHVSFTHPVDKSKVSFTGPDFFLARTDNGEFAPEIHRCNYEPLNESAYYAVDHSNINPNSRYYYKSKDNLVWAVNIPADVAHTYEKSDFLKAYPEFSTWAQSNGVLAKDWYKRGVSEYLVKKK